MWTDNIAKAEVKNVPVGAILIASAFQAGGVVAYGALQRKYPANATLAKWAPTMVGAAGAVVMPQTRKWTGDAFAKSAAIGLGNVALAPWIGALCNMILYPPPGQGAGRKAAQKRVAGAGPQGSQTNPTRRMDLNGEAAAKDLKATLH